MSNVSAPLGFKPLRSGYGYGWSGAVSTYPIITAYATTIYCGDVVKFITTGYINRAAAGDQMRGIFVGCQYTDSTGKPVISNYWPASTATQGSKDVTAFVIDDPNVTYEAQVSAAMASAQTDIGATINILATAGSTATGLSAESLDYSTLNTTAIQFRILRYLPRVDNDTSATAFTRVECVPALHDFRVNTGI